MNILVLCHDIVEAWVDPSQESKNKPCLCDLRIGWVPFLPDMAPHLNQLAWSQAAGMADEPESEGTLHHAVHPTGVKAIHGIPDSVWVFLDVVPPKKHKQKSRNTSWKSLKAEF